MYYSYLINLLKTINFSFVVFFNSIFVYTIVIIVSTIVLMWSLFQITLKSILYIYMLLNYDSFEWFIGIIRICKSSFLVLYLVLNIINIRYLHAFDEASLTPASTSLFRRYTYVTEYELIKLKTSPLHKKLANTTIHDRTVHSDRLFSWLIIL